MNYVSHESNDFIRIVEKNPLCSLQPHVHVMITIHEIVCFFQQFHKYPLTHTPVPQACILEAIKKEKSVVAISTHTDFRKIQSRWNPAAAFPPYWRLKKNILALLLFSCILSRTVTCCHLPIRNQD